jgi:two-component system, response regulator PdtaR
MADPARVSVLTAEDNPIVRAELRLVLEQAGYDVCGDARDGEEAVRLAREHRPDLILLDLSLPHLDGVEAAKQIRAERNIPFVAVTGYREGDLVDRARAAGAASVVLKPYRDEAIISAVRLAVPPVVESDAVAAARRSPRSARSSTWLGTQTSGRTTSKRGRSRPGRYGGACGSQGQPPRRAAYPSTSANPVVRGVTTSGLSGRPEVGSTLKAPGATSFGVSGWKRAARSWMWSRPAPSSN